MGVSERGSIISRSESKLSSSSYSIYRQLAPRRPNLNIGGHILDSIKSKNSLEK